jgi:fused signal recognition particle receptor
MSILNLLTKKNKEKLNQALAPSKNSLWTKVHRSLAGKSTIDTEVLDQLEEVLIAADIGVDTTIKIINNLEKRISLDKYLHVDELRNILQEEIAILLTIPTPATEETISPHVILVTGVNGVGKTTTIGKLAALYKQAGKYVILGAADTFRAAAVDQLKFWGERVGVPVVAHATQSDPSAVAYETIQQALKSQAGIVIIDTAGRLHTKIHLMHELTKIQRTIAKLVPTAPHEVLLVLDATTGQNAFMQTKAFTEASAVTGLVVTKLDGTAKGGVVIGIIDQFHIPVKYIGIGEQVEDLQVFEAKGFVEALMSQALPLQA